MDISKDELAALIEGAVTKAMKAHVCVFSSEEKQILKDLATGGKAFKRIIIYLVVGFVLVGIGINHVPGIIKAFK
jgi:hypothetical protein